MITPSLKVHGVYGVYGVYTRGATSSILPMSTPMATCTTGKLRPDLIGGQGTTRLWDSEKELAFAGRHTGIFREASAPRHSMGEAHHAIAWDHRQLGHTVAIECAGVGSEVLQKRDDVVCCDCLPDHPQTGVVQHRAGTGQA